MKYFNFLLENEINFTRDETGHYVALVKVLNPQFFGEKEQLTNNNNNNKIKFETQDNTKDLFTPQKPRSTSQVISNREKRDLPQSAKSIRPKSPIIINNNNTKANNKIEKNKTQNIKIHSVKH